ncbi:MAG: 4Fe-4S dicluster domain-containing protein [Candidatus Binatia bacterium]
MGTNWGLFLCNCRATIPLDPERLVFPIAPSVFSFASDPQTEISEFAARALQEQPDRVMIGCCAAPGLFQEVFAKGRATIPQLHFVNLKESCFVVHSDPQQAHEKATRLLRAAMEIAESAIAPPSYNSLTVGNRILIAGDFPLGNRLAEKITDGVQPLLVVAPGVSPFDVPPSREVSTGRVVDVKGRLGSFQVTVEDVESNETPRREMKADQVVVISSDEKPFFEPRTGLHLLNNPSDADLERAAERIHELTGEFLKPLHVTYNAGICAGGTANHQACGICITACPYDAISRDPQNHLRVKIDHMACEGCGACVSACPTSALRFTEPSPQELYARITALLTSPPGQNGGEALTILFHCGEQGRHALEQAGRRALSYPAGVLPVEVPCLRYVSEANMLAPFRLGAAGVGLLGCEKCQHGERDLLYQKLDFCRLTLDAFNIGPERLRLITTDNGREAETIATLSSFVEALGAPPIHWNGRAMQRRDNREVIAEAIAAFIDQTGQEPGQKPLDPTYPFAFAEVRAAGCTMCRSCVNVCPTHAFRLDENTQSLQFKHISCVACGLCEKVCPENVIALEREIHFDRDALDYKTIVQDNMVSCVKCGKPYINRRALEIVEARLLSLESLFDTFSGSRRDILRMCPDCRTVVAMLEVEKGWKP